jgi:hypothetical protein
MGVAVDSADARDQRRRLCVQRALGGGSRPRDGRGLPRDVPLESKIIHVRWSGEGGWIPMGDLEVGIGPENATSYPSPGELIFYPGGVSETELLLAYGYRDAAGELNRHDGGGAGAPRRMAGAALAEVRTDRSLAILGTIC